ncbi:PREDICTED: G-type lectin S-receptor-like serine/threonine-protein kinase RKS1 [Nelumbo nucifera]|uniref:Receptor-like serine/threonine-protein kinase n=2 Tax=Nelumbo nucifera TaxID=4432 RepID=A0A1U7ZHR0_NELNU|nr:PREDICTED: G-type lectin S-receptor-like serine/threonine-protein kinase RKS1 [Nelumbo nucifera]DAD23159.1 TPA_asm: hypothetical protein HUJ06_024622 [Nelumbo nucifera]
MVSHKRLLMNTFSLFLVFQFCHSIDTITANQSITDDGDSQILVSAGKHFVLGFFSPGNSSNRYVGIWYNASKQMVVWVANREKPIKGSTGVFKISREGNLVIIDRNQEGPPLWSANNISIPSNKYFAKLLDNGNLVLSPQDDSGNIVWQSFDYPTHTHLPGMQLGFNRQTGKNKSLTSWKSPDDPASGDYSLQLDPQGSPQLFLYKGSVPVWRSGPWMGDNWSGVHQPMGTFFHYQYVNSSDEVYVTYNNTANFTFSIYAVFMLNDSGSFQWLIWSNVQPVWTRYWEALKERCDEYGRCGGYSSCTTNANNGFECACVPGFQPNKSGAAAGGDGSEGCVRERRLECGLGKAEEEFLKLEHVKLPDTVAARVLNDRSMSQEECEKECLSNCNCTGYSKVNISGGGSGSGCMSWYGELMDIRHYSDGGQDLYVRVARRNSKGFNKRRMLVALLTVPVILLAFILCCYYLLQKRQRKVTTKMQPHQELLFNSNANPEEFKSSFVAAELQEAEINSELSFFDLSVVVAATDNFSSSNKLGQGGFGPVYKGRLSNGQEIAVKRLSKYSGQGIVEFKNEVMLIAKLQHRNLVRLLGCCIQDEEKMLIYEYMPNKSLDYFLFDETRRQLLQWEKRLEIIVGIARGVLYLHQDSLLRIIHRDLKASNILLDSDMNPKISDFGMARIFGRSQTEANTNRVVGTYGYMSPEYAMDGLFSVKSDVFSFGVLLLEIISGKKNTGYNYKDPYMNLIGHAWELWREGKGLDIVDSCMGEGDCYPGDEVLRCIHVGLLCVQESPSDRPTMSNVVFMLSNQTIMPPPNQPAFIMKRAPYADSSSSATGTASCSINEVTISVVEGR